VEWIVKKARGRRGRDSGGQEQGIKFWAGLELVQILKKGEGVSWGLGVWSSGRKEQGSLKKKDDEDRD